MDVFDPGTEPRGWKKQASALCRQIVADTPDATWPVHDADFAIELLHRRTEPETLARKIPAGIPLVGFIVRLEPRHHTNRQFAAVRGDGVITGLSWVKAVQATWATDPEGFYRSRVLASMRNAIAAQALSYLHALPAWTPCALCGSFGPLEADHHPVKFIDLAQGFTSGNWRAVHVAASDDTWGSVLDADFTVAWQAHHRKYAQFRPLCSSCN